MINELKQRSPFGSVPSFPNTDKELQRNGLLVIYGNRSSGVMINCIKKYQSLNANQNQFFSLVQVHWTKKKKKMKKKSFNESQW